MLSSQISDKTVVTEKDSHQAKRRALLQTSWAVPVVSVIALPVHAQTSSATTTADPSAAKEAVEMVAEVTEASLSTGVKAKLSSVKRADGTDVSKSELQGERVLSEIKVVRASGDVVIKSTEITVGNQFYKEVKTASKVEASDLASVAVGETMVARIKMVSTATSKFSGEATASKAMSA